MFYFIIKIHLEYFTVFKHSFGATANVNSLEKVHIYKTPAPTQGVAI